MNVFQKIGRFLTGASTTINPGAVIPIVVRCPETYPRVANCLYAPNAEHPLSIGMSESWNKACGQILHEYQHAIEVRLTLAGNVDGVATVRKTFRDLCHGSFELGHDDLLEEIP